MSLPTDTLGPFDVKTDDLVQIDADQAVELFRQLLVIEAMQVGIPVTGVDVPASINVADGGIDAEVSGASSAVLPAGLIAEGLTRYQIKTGSFSASIPSEVRSLLVQPKFMKGNHTPAKDELQPRVLSCFEQGGTFVVVLFGSDLVGTSDDHGATQIRAFMTAIDPAFASVTVRIVRANQLCAAIKVLAPGIALRLNRVQGYDDAVFQDIQFMAESCNLMMDGYRPTEELDSAAAQITSAADNINGFQHVRVLGDAGAGKTHLIYRALSAAQLPGCVLYCRDPERALTSGPMMTLRNMAPKTTIILVADECDLETMGELMALFKRLATHMLLVTAHNVAERASDHVNTQVIEVPRLEPPVVREIFEGYGIPPADATWLADLCAGSPRAAHALGQYIQNNPSQHKAQQLAHLDRLWDRMVCEPHSVDSPSGHERLAVMRTLALFRQVAWETEDGAAVQAAILSALQELDHNFSKLRLSQCVSDLRLRRVLQGPRTLLISPTLLHVSMWKSWFESYANLVDAKLLRDGLNARMQQHFDAMLVYAQESKAATRWAERLLGDGGIFASLATYNNTSNASLFFAVAQANPEVALRRFAMALGDAPVEERMQLARESRRTAIHRLEQLAIPAETFFDAAQCLLLLAEAENESWSNNATGVFVSLFDLGSGEMAASEVAPSEKIGYLTTLLHDAAEKRRELAVQALTKSLDPFKTRDVIEEVIGLRRLPSRWTAQTYDELYDAYAAHVQVLTDAAEYLPEPEALAAAKGLLGNVRSLIMVPKVADKILVFLHRASGRPGLREQCIEAIVTTLHHEGAELPARIKSELLTLRNALTHSNFEQKLRRYAGMKLLEDSFDADGEYHDDAQPELISLAEQAAATPELLRPELAWVVTEDAKNGFQFGQLLGQRDEHKLWDAILRAWIDAGERRSDFFIGGYLSAWHSADVASWETVVEGLLRTEGLTGDAVGVIWRSGMSAGVAWTLLGMAQRGELDPTAFRLFIYGGIVSKFPDAVVAGVLDLLVDRTGPNAAVAALEILDSRLRGHPEKLPDMTVHIERVLNLAAFVEGGPDNHANHMMLFSWNEMALRLLGIDPDAGARLAVRCIANFARENSVTAGYDPEPLTFLSKAASARPDVVWHAIARRLEMPRRELGNWHLLQWLRGGRPGQRHREWALSGIPTSLIFEWIDGDAANRAWILAEYCPATISKPGEPTTFARALLERHGDREEVRNSLHANSFTGSWAGPASEHYGHKLESVKAQLVLEHDAHVRKWLMEEREQLEETVKRERDRETREDEY
jgi:hypothetical protein